MKNLLLIFCFLIGFFLAPVLVFAGTVEDIAVKGLMWLAAEVPVVGLIAVFLGGLFVLLEFFFKAKGEQPGEKQFLALKSGYIGPFINLCVNLFKTKVFNK